MPMTSAFTRQIFKFIILLTLLSGKVLYSQIDIVKELDFSRCGYAGNDIPVPFVKAVYSVGSIDADATELIQQAINKVSSWQMDKNGFRGAVLLENDNYKIYGKLVISASGVVLRGSENTVLVAAGNKRRTLIEVKGQAACQVSKSVYNIKDTMVKPGAEKLRLANVKGLKVGDEIFIMRPCTDKWIKELKMDSFVGLFAEFRLNWAVGSREVKWDRKITRIEDDTIFFDGPITTELDANFGQSHVVGYKWPGRINNVGIENLKCVSEYDQSNPKDEEHSWICINMSNVKDSWIRNIEAVHFVASAVMLQPSSMHITVDNCRFLEPISEIGGLRRVSFYNAGQFNLIKKCRARNGRHDFVVGFCSAGPNVYQDCVAEEALNFSGSLESWACGALFDNVTVYGQNINLGNLKTYSQGAGYSASNCVVWNCNASELNIKNPPHSVNYIYGSCGRMTADAAPVMPYRVYPTRSLFDQQLESRLGREKFKKIMTTAEFPPENPLKFVFNNKNKAPATNVSERPIEIINGRFVCNGEIFWSGHQGTEVWRGSMVPLQAKKSAPSLTRFVPGREGSGLMDNLVELADTLLSTDRHMLSQRPSLWYDRRRADHQWVKRKDGNVWGPLLEMPWARSGIGTAWDGLSKYDLTKFNPWYFSRIKEFADFCDQKQLLLYNEIYDNHNFIENGSHWVDFPWRPVNAVQNTGFTEPPPFTHGPHSNNHNFIAIADEFYDISDPARNKLHQLYIRKYLDTLEDNKNVIHTIAHQYSGTLEFAKFFFDTVIHWQNENNVNLKWAVQTGKNVTDALLSDSRYRNVISVIDLQYWQYLEDGELYAPQAGLNEAFRQIRKSSFPKGKRPPSTPELLYKQVREYRDRYSEKALIAYVAGVGPLPIMMAGGAYAIYQYDGLTESPKMSSFNHFIKTNLSGDLWKMDPDDHVVVDPKNNWCLSDHEKTYLIYTLDGHVAARFAKGNYKYRWFSPEGDILTNYENMDTAGNISLTSPEKNPALLLIQNR